MSFLRLIMTDNRKPGHCVGLFCGCDLFVMLKVVRQRIVNRLIEFNLNQVVAAAFQAVEVQTALESDFCISLLSHK